MDAGTSIIFHRVVATCPCEAVDVSHMRTIDELKRYCSLHNKAIEETTSGCVNNGGVVSVIVGGMW